LRKKLWIYVVLSIALSGCSLLQDDRTTYTPTIIPAFYEESSNENIVWKEGPTFPYDGAELIGTKGTIGVTANPWKAGVVDEYTWHFFGERIPTGPFTVVAVKQGTSEPHKAIFLGDDTTAPVWSTNPVIMDSAKDYAELPVSMMLPSTGMWVLHAYVGEVLSGQIVVNVE
jgi:hypothetical protein